MKEIQEKLENHEKRILTTEMTITPLLAQLSELTATMTKNTEQMALSNVNHAASKETFERAFDEIKALKRIQSSDNKEVRKIQSEIKLEQAENRPVMKAVGKMYYAMATVAITMIALLGTTILK